jgi:hypothetical protein
MRRKNQKKGLYCNNHKKENMINIQSNKCIELNCTIQASFNLITEKKGIYCSKHKKENMFDIMSKSKICIEDKCTKHSNFNYHNEKKAIYCSSHKKENMVNINDRNCICALHEYICNKEYTDCPSIQVPKNVFLVCKTTF